MGDGWSLFTTSGHSGSISVGDDAMQRVNASIAVSRPRNSSPKCSTKKKKKKEKQNSVHIDQTFSTSTINPVQCWKKR